MKDRTEKLRKDCSVIISELCNYDVSNEKLLDELVSLDELELKQYKYGLRKDLKSYEKLNV